jgi:cell division GTPase FtsZ
VNAAAEEIYQAVDVDANIIFGASVDESVGPELIVTVVATGFPAHLGAPGADVFEGIISNGSGGEQSSATPDAAGKITPQQV